LREWQVAYAERPPRQRVQDAGTSKVTGRAERSDHAVEVPIILQNVRFVYGLRAAQLRI